MKGGLIAWAQMGDANASIPTPQQADLKGNDAMPTIEVDPRTFQVRIDAELVREDPVAIVPLAQRYTMI